jgi:hypothetical protein
LRRERKHGATVVEAPSSVLASAQHQLGHLILTMQSTNVNEIALRTANDLRLGDQTDEFRALVASVASGDTTLRELETRGEGELVAMVSLLFNAVQAAVSIYQARVSMRQTQIAAEQTRIMRDAAEKKLSPIQLEQIMAEVEQRLSARSVASVPTDKRQGILAGVVRKIFG